MNVPKKIMAIIKSGEKYLLLKTNPEIMGVDEWYVVTGSVESGEAEEKALKREVAEETGLKILKIEPLGMIFEYEWPKDSGRNYSEKAFLVEVGKGECQISSEHTQYQWLELNQFIDKLHWYGDKSELMGKLSGGDNG